MSQPATDSIEEAGGPTAAPLPISRGGRLWVVGTLAITGASFVAAIALAPHAGNNPSQGLAWLLAIGSSVHVASTAWLYTLPEVRSYANERRIRYLWTPLSLIVGAAVIASLMSPRYLVWPLLGFFAWQFFHFQRQNLGITALTASSLRAQSLSVNERRALMLAGWTGTFGLLSHPKLLQLNIHLGIEAAFDISAVAFVVACAAGIATLVNRSPINRPPAFCAIYLMSLLFPLPIFVFSSPYAAVGGLTIAHGMQYLVLIGLVAAGNADRMSRFIRLSALCNIALIGGVLISVASHLHESRPFVRLFYGASLGLVMAHFVIDAGVWRLRDPFPRSLVKRNAPYLLPDRVSSAVVGDEM